MTTFETTKDPRFRDGHSPIARFFARLDREAETRKWIVELGKLDDHLLRDMGFDSDSIP